MTLTNGHNDHAHHDYDPDVNVTMSNAVTLSSNNTSLSHHQHVTAAYVIGAIQ